jgi:hypothetical protein
MLWFDAPVYGYRYSAIVIVFPPAMVFFVFQKKFCGNIPGRIVNGLALLGKEKVTLFPGFLINQICIIVELCLISVGR